MHKNGSMHYKKQMIEQVDFEKYAHSYEEAQKKIWLMDKRHISIIHNIIMGNNFKRIVQVGVYTGFSSNAAFTALDKGKDFELHLVDSNCWNNVVEVVSGETYSEDIDGIISRCINLCSSSEKIFYHNMTSEEFLKKNNEPIDLLIIDADHDIPNASTDFFYAIENNVENIISHDSNSWINTEWGHYCLGSKQIAKILQNDRRFYCLEDKEDRPNESTFRGLIYATMKQELFEAAEPIFKEFA